jgi:ArsR family transcriptional regulator, arsenate/arsenite/antimonite-responsive transcriptional repressor
VFWATSQRAHFLGFVALCICRFCPSSAGLVPWNMLAKAASDWYREMVKRTAKTRDMADFADMFAAMGAEQRLQIMRILLSAHPKGMVVGDVLAALPMPASTLSHHLEKLRHEGLVSVRRDTKFLWYTANTEALEDLITFLYSECCSRSQAIKPDVLIKLCK